MSGVLAAQVFAEEWPKLVATLVRDLGDVQLAEDCAQEAFVEAAARWGPGRTPDRPGAWLLTAARRKAIDTVRRDRRFATRQPELRRIAETPPREPTGLVDDQLALIFGCCHPSLERDAQIALTLRVVCGLSTTQIAAAFLVPQETMAKRLVRAKAKIRLAGIPFKVPPPETRNDRLAAVLHVVYLIFTEGHTGTDTASLVRGDLCDEARFLVGLLDRLQPDDPDVLALAALLCFTDARRATRVDAEGGLILLEDQDRARWDADLIAAGRQLLGRAFGHGRVGVYHLQAAIAAVHATAPSYELTEWRSIVALYDAMMRLDPAPVVALNRAVAVAMADGPTRGLAALDELAADGGLDGYRYLPAARADLMRRLGLLREASAAYEEALGLTDNAAERRFLARRLDEVRRADPFHLASGTME